MSASRSAQSTRPRIEYALRSVPVQDGDHRHVRQLRFSERRPLDRVPWLPSARECEIITAPNRTDRHIQLRRTSMSVYRVIDVIGTSTTSWEEAAADAIRTAGTSVRDIRVAEIVKQDIHVGDGGELIYRTRIQLSFRYEQRRRPQRD